jgi:hypothetical protein
MRVFYSHPVRLYGSDAERREIAQIEKRFVGSEVVDPSAHRSSAGAERETEFYLRLVDGCDCLVFSRSFGYITEGVRKEVDYALSKKKQVYELKEGRFIAVAGPVANLPLAKRLVLRARSALGLARGESG